MEIRFLDHSSFQRATAGMVGGSLLLGAALQPVTPMASLAGGLLGIAAGAALVQGGLVWRAMAAVAAIVPLVALAPSWPVLAAVAALTALALAVGGPRGLRGLLGLGLGTAAVMIAMWCALRIDHASATVHWPPLVTAATAAAAMGLVAAMARMPRHLRIARDPVRAAMARLPVSLDAEVVGLCARAAAIWSTSRERIGDDAGRALVCDGVGKTLEVAARSAELVSTGPSDAELAQRLADLDQRIAAASDGEVKAEYRAARAAIGDQQRYRERIRQGRERLIARMHNHVAALEKFDLAATGLEAARAASAGATAMKQLEELSRDVAASGEALAELVP